MQTRKNNKDTYLVKRSRKDLSSESGSGSDSDSDSDQSDSEESSLFLQVADHTSFTDKKFNS